MFTIFNIMIIVLVLLIAYWWANQGLFSAILHLICVIAAGAVTLAIWEPITVGLLLRGSAFDNYAWGVSFLGIFAIVLLILRVAMDKIVPSNVNVPNWASLSFGFPIGLAAGIITIGMFMIGAGFIQSGKEIMGFRGWARSSQNGRVEEVNKLWVPVHKWTYEFYALLSVGSLHPTFERSPLRQYYPDLYKQATLLRDGALNGRAKLSLRPRDARIVDVFHNTEGRQNRYAVRIAFEPGARDHGEQLTLSRSQIRLIGEARGTAEAKVAYPEEWTQYDGVHKFDDITHYAISEPAQSQTTLVFLFNAQDLEPSKPKFIQIRGTRYRLQAVQEASYVDFSRLRDKEAVGSLVKVALDPSAKSIQDFIELSNRITPVMVSTNQLPSGVEVTDDKFLLNGDGEFAQRGERPSRLLIVKGIFESKGTRIVQLNVSRESPANVFGKVRENSGEDAQMMLVDQGGRSYLPIGFIHEKPGGGSTRIKLDFTHNVPAIKDVPNLPTSGGQTLRMLFRVTEGVTIAGFKCGEITVGTCSLYVEPLDKPKELPSQAQPKQEPLEGEKLPKT